MRSLPDVPDLSHMLSSVPWHFLVQEVEGTFYMRLDYSIECYNDEWSIYAAIAILGILLYCFGIPLFDYIVLFQNQHKLFTEEKFSNRFGFIYARFKEKFFFWELVEMLRKFMMSGILMFVKAGSYEQITVGVGFAVTFLALQVCFSPYDEDVDNNLAAVGGVATTATLLVAVLIKSGQTGGATTGIIMGVNLLVFVCTIYFICFKIIPDFIEDNERRIKRAMFIAKKAKQKALEKLDNHGMEIGVSSNGNAVSNGDVKKEGWFGKPDLEPVSSDISKVENPLRPDVQTSTKLPDDEELRDIQMKYFNRYDLDGSQTINSAEELMQLCTNLTVKLDLKVRIQRLQDMVIRLVTWKKTIGTSRNSRNGLTATYSRCHPHDCLALMRLVWA